MNQKLVVPKKIVITGAPGSGKTSVINSLEKLGYHCYHEIIRDMTASAKNKQPTQEQMTNPLAFVDDPMAFNKNLLKGRKAHYLNALTQNKTLCFFDRGIPDVLAYMDYFEQKYPLEFEATCKAHTYDIVFILPPWEEIYVSDNERLESFEEAQALDIHLFDTYKRFGYTPIVVPKSTIEERTQFVINTSIS